MFDRAEQGRFNAQGRRVMKRRWNGDQVDHGLNFIGKPVVPKIKMGHYK